MVNVNWLRVVRLTTGALAFVPRRSALDRHGRHIRNLLVKSAPPAAVPHRFLKFTPDLPMLWPLKAGTPAAIVFHLSPFLHFQGAHPIPQ